MSSGRDDTVLILQYTAKVLNNFNTILDSGSKIFVDKLNSHLLDKIKLELFVTHSWTLYCTYLAAELHKVIFLRWRFDVNDDDDDSMKIASLYSRHGSNNYSDTARRGALSNSMRFLFCVAGQSALEWEANLVFFF